MGRLETGRSGEESHDIWLLNEHKQNTFPWNVCRNVFPKIGLSGWTVVLLSVAYTVFLIFSSFLGAHIFIKSLKNVISYFNLTKHVRGRLPSPGMRARLKIKIWFFFFCGFISCPKPGNLQVAYLESGEQEKQRINKHLHYLAPGL